MRNITSVNSQAGAKIEAFLYEARYAREGDFPPLDVAELGTLPADWLEKYTPPEQWLIQRGIIVHNRPPEDVRADKLHRFQSFDR